MMKIAHVSATFPPYRGGTGNVCFHNARQLARLGHEVHVFTASYASAPALEDSEGFTVHRLRPLVQVGNAPVLPQLLSVLRGFDLIHLHYPFILGAEMVRLASILYRTPLVISFHNDLIGNGARKLIFKVYQHISVQLTVRGAERLCAVSQDHYDSSMLCRSLNGAGQPASRGIGPTSAGIAPIKGQPQGIAPTSVGFYGPTSAGQPRGIAPTSPKMGGNGHYALPRVVELPNGVDIDHFCPTGRADIRQRYKIPANAKVLLFIAALDRAHHFKGLGTLLEAVQALRLSDTWLLVVGDGDLRATYEVLAEALGIAERTIFVGGVNNKETALFYRSADVTVLPSSPPESFGLVLIESLACGTPVIASEIPGVRTVVTAGEDGFFVEPNNVNDLVAKLEAILSLPAHERQKMGLAGRCNVEKRYAWNQIGIKLERLYKQLLPDAP